MATPLAAVAPVRLAVRIEETASQTIASEGLPMAETFVLSAPYAAIGLAAETAAVARGSIGKAVASS